MPVFAFWPALVVLAACFQVVRNAAQRELTERLGVWGASYIRFIYGLPFALAWTAIIVAWRGYSGGPGWAFAGWIVLGAGTQAAATAALVLAMRTRAFAVATALSKTEMPGVALFGVLMIQDRLTTGDWIGAAVGTAGAVLMAHVSPDRASLRAGLAGAGAGLLYAMCSVAYRGAAHAWGEDPWVGAAMSLSATLAVQAAGGAALMRVLAPKSFAGVLQAWRPSLAPGAAGAAASALLFTSFAIAPSTAAVKIVQLVDVLIAWGVSRRLFREEVRRREMAGAVLVVLGALSVLVA